MSQHPAAWPTAELVHDPIEKLEANLWRVEAPVPKMALRRVMTVIRRSDGGLLVHSPIPLTPAAMDELDAWGPVRMIVAPSSGHRLGVAPYKSRYPEAAVVCPLGARKAVEKVVPVDRTYDQLPEAPDLTVRHLAGTNDREGVLIVRHQVGATLVFNDILFNMPHLSGPIGWVLRHVTHSTGGPRISRIARMMLMANRAELVDDLLRLSETDDLVRIIVSHHQIIQDDPATALQKAARALDSN